MLRQSPFMGMIKNKKGHKCDKYQVPATLTKIPTLHQVVLKKVSKLECPLVNHTKSELSC